MSVCQDCIYRQDEQCHRFPPVPVFAPNGGDYGDAVLKCWPEIRLNDVCGEHPNYLAFFAAPKPRRSLPPRSPQ